MNPADLAGYEFLITRHPESQGNQQGVFVGGTVDSPLSPKGEQDAYKIRELLEKLKDSGSDIMPDHIIHTDMLRTRRSAETANTSLGLPMFPEPSLKERNWGRLAGVAKAGYPRHHPNRINPPDGESRDEFYARSNQAMADILAKRKGELPFFIAHKGTIEGLIESQGYELPGEPANAVLYRFKPKARHVSGEFPWELNTIALDEKGMVAESPVMLHKVQGHVRKVP